MREREFVERQLRLVDPAGCAGLVGFVAVVLTIWLLRRFDGSGATLGFLVPFGLSLGVVLALVLGAALPARVLGVEWPLAIGGAFGSHATTVVLALVAEFYTGYSDPFALAITAGFGAFIRFGVAPGLEIDGPRLTWLTVVTTALALLAWRAPAPFLAIPGSLWVVIPALVAMWDAESP